jgi:phage terminase large subunit-like protein
MATRRSTELPVPRKALDRWLTKEQLEEAVAARPAVWTPTVRKVEGAWFDPDAVDRVLKALSNLKHTKGRWARTPFVPDPWQILWVIAPIFGWKHPPTVEFPQGLRVIRTAWIEVPRKNGKSTMSSGLGLVLLSADSEPGAEVYAAATTKPQAGIVFGEALKMAMASPALRDRIDPLREVIRYPSTGSIFRVLSKVAEAAHGLNPSGAVIDEIHVHKSRGLVDAIETGTGSRAQPLVIFITTSDDGDDTTIYGEKHNYTRKLADGSVTDATHYGVIWAASKDDDPFVEATWKKANPGYGKTVSVEYLRKEANKARETPSYFPTFCRLHLNLRMRIEGKWFTPRQWDKGLGMVDEAELKGRDCYAGIDLSNVSDFAVWLLLFPPVEGDPDGGRWKVLPRIFVPAEAVDRRAPIRNQLIAWERAGRLTITEGDMTHYDAIETQAEKDASTFNVIEAAYDPWNSTQLISHLMEKGMTVWPLSQSIAKLNSPTKELERMVGAGDLNHGGHPVLRWMALNAVLRSDANGNIAADKKKSADKIDGISALVNAVAAATRERDQIVTIDGDLAV